MITYESPRTFQSDEVPHVDKVKAGNHKIGRRPEEANEFDILREIHLITANHERVNTNTSCGDGSGIACRSVLVCGFQMVTNLTVK